MSKETDWYPLEPRQLVQFYNNLNETLPQVAERYNISPETLEIVARNYNWIAYWTMARYQLENQRQQITAYYQAITRNRPGTIAPTTPALSLPPEMPPEAAPGIEFFTRKLRRQILAHLNYTRADGERLGFYNFGAPPASKKDAAAQFSANALGNFTLFVKFRKYGADALRLEYRRREGEWQVLTIALVSPLKIRIPPHTEGEPEQIELRGILLKRDETIGDYSPIVSVVIHD